MQSCRAPCMAGFMRSLLTCLQSSPTSTCRGRGAGWEGKHQESNMQYQPQLLIWGEVRVQGGEGGGGGDISSRTHIQNPKSSYGTKSWSACSVGKVVPLAPCAAKYSESRDHLPVGGGCGGGRGRGEGHVPLFAVLQLKAFACKQAAHLPTIPPSPPLDRTQPGIRW